MPVFHPFGSNVIQILPQSQLHSLTGLSLPSSSPSHTVCNRASFLEPRHVPLSLPRRFPKRIQKTQTRRFEPTRPEVKAHTTNPTENRDSFDAVDGVIAALKGPRRADACRLCDEL
jgi:hypothetical protein